ncbi:MULTISPECIES: DUF2382 domain-containing protein [Streptomyces]|uniref:DUF2382 domain-containing protein n=1 Tax=Streptomyces TaxID=1883 RepID=UPI001D150FDE|nr:MULTISPECIES: PRC and DUF2382 domain-containing protein [Streptomyces]MCC3655720.1 PRC and DUF2382 domain-containing protein [Streptomyces sp. S07_1.15]WSQ69969.1 PRC and DUF2382 domain-containing protein [Streptomyces xinghaiensis]
MISYQDLDRVADSTAVGTDGKLGKVSQVYVDDRSNRPEWATVQTGMFGTKESFVPLAEARLADGSLELPYDKEKVKNAPRVEADQGHVSESEESELYRYYGIPRGEAQRPEAAAGRTGGERGRGSPAGERPSRPVGRDTSGPTTDEAMTRSEERLRVGTESVESGKAHLRKHVVTENVTRTVPVSHEEVRVEREPITEANRDRAMRGPAISEEEHEVTLHEERPVVEKETVPVERVRLDTETVTEQQEVSEQVRKERIDSDADDTRRRRGR